MKDLNRKQTLPKGERTGEGSVGEKCLRKGKISANLEGGHAYRGTRS